MCRTALCLRISIHAPHEGERPSNRALLKAEIEFQSTLPTRGSDSGRAPLSIAAHYFNPRSPRGGATSLSIAFLHKKYISIHAPHEGERLSAAPAVPAAHHFNPRSPRGGATCCRRRLPARPPISIHAPHEGERRRKSAFVCSISANLLNIIHCGTVTRAVSRRRIALFRLFSVRRSGVFMYAYASH